MSFRLGKYQIILALLGILFGAWHSFRRRQIPKRYLFFFFLTGTALFLMTAVSMPVWNLARWLAGLFQFPWRFMAFVIVGVAFFNGLLIESLGQKRVVTYLGVLLSVGVLLTQAKYFSKPWLFSYDEYMVKYGSRDYIENRAAYEAAEYISVKTDYATWRSYQGKTAPSQSSQWQGTPYDRTIVVSEAKTVLPIHYYPQWRMSIDGVTLTPSVFDKLGRPVIDTSSYVGKTIRVRYNETLIERLSTIISALVLLCVALYPVIKKNIWKNQRHTNK